MRYIATPQKCFINVNKRQIYFIRIFIFGFFENIPALFIDIIHFADLLVEQEDIFQQIRFIRFINLSIVGK
ncbi:MAG: hypothetical protein HN342_15565 [Nitrospina sp.]|nr:hypothetical protein [Nitrospina sp.]